MLNKLFPSVRRRSKERQKFEKFRAQLRELDYDATETIDFVKDYTVLDPDKLYSLIQAVRYVCRHGIAGDFVECGVWRGGAVMAAACTMRQLNVTDRMFYLYDTFTGMPAPTARDRELIDKVDAAGRFRKSQTGPDSSDWRCASADEVRANLAQVAYDQSKFILVEGKVEDTLPHVLPERIALLRLDTDWYESTKHEMEHLMPRLVSKGVLIIDDYFWWAGNREAVDEYLDRHDIPILLTKVGGSAVGVRP
jgi:O-methyltransferase